MNDARGLHAVHDGELDVHHDRVGTVEPGELDRLAAARGLGHHDDPAPLERVADGPPGERVAVGEHGADRRVLAVHIEVHFVSPVLP